ncbi:MAG: hypothetical protein KGZ68_04385 [Dechloromonas sp.]|nr:hypothetical protein [Dechloromonas sp.]
MTIEDKVARLIEAGCENLYPKFIHGTGSDRSVVAEVVAGELLVYPDGELLLAAPRQRATRQPRVQKPDAQVETPTETAPESPE